MNTEKLVKSVNTHTQNIIDINSSLESKANEKTLQRLKASLGTKTYGDINLPNDFPNIGFELWRDRMGVIQHNFNFNAYKNGTIVYVDSTRGSEGDGTYANPYRTLSNAIYQCNLGADTKYTIYCKSVRFDRGFSIQNVTISGKTIAILPDPISNTANKIILSNHYKSLAWSVDGVLWKATRSSIVNVYDIRNVDKYGMYKPLTNVASLSECQSQRNTWYTDNINIWINTNDGLTPNDTNFIINVANSTFEPNVINGGKLYIENASIIYGRTSPDNRPTGDTSTTEFIAYNCLFSGGYLMSNITSNGGNGLSILDIRRTYLFNCICAYSGEDGFNYHYTSLGGLSLAVEFNCLSYKNGTFSTTNTSNSTTSHDGGRILRVGCVGFDSKGPTCADVDGCYSIFYDCNMGEALNINGGVKASYQFYGTSGKAILENCGGGSGNTLSIHTPSDFSVTLKSFRGFNFLDDFNPIILS